MNNLNLSTPVILFGWFILFLVIYNIYRFTKVLSRKRFLLAVAGSLFLLFFALIFNRDSDELPPISNRLVILPPIEQFDSRPIITPQGFFIADQLINLINYSTGSACFAVPLEWLLQSTPPDSLKNANSQYRQSQLLRAEYLISGILHHSKSRKNLELIIYHLPENQILATPHYAFAEDKSDDLVHQIIGDLSGLLHMPIEQTINTRFHSISYWQQRLRLLNGDSSENRIRGSTEPMSPADSLALIARAKLNDDALAEIPLEKRRQQLRPLQHGLLQLTEKDTANAELNLLTARCLLWCEEFAQVEAYLKRIIRQQPQRAEAYLFLSQLHFSRYRSLGFENEIDLLETAQRFNPADPDLVCKIANAYVQSDKIDKAVKLLEKYRRRQPDNFMLLKALGQVYIKQGKTLEIFKIYNQILEMDPQNAEAFYNLGIHYFYSGENAIAKRFFRQALKYGQQVDSYLYLAHIAEKEDSTEQAIGYLQKRLEFGHKKNDPFAEEARRRLFRLSVQSGKIDSSGRILEPAD